MAVPAVMPVTEPESLTVAIAGLLLVHIPPSVVSPSVVDEPAQTVVKPVIGPTVAKDELAINSRNRVVFKNSMYFITNII